MLKKIYDFIIKLIFPPRCILCNDILEWTENGKENICKVCIDSIEYILNPTCKHCGKMINKNKMHKCDQKYKNIYYDNVICVCRYAGGIKEGIVNFKFYNKVYLYKFFSNMLYKRLKELDLKFDFIISVPIHNKRLEDRGYNQADLIANEVAVLMDIPLIDGLIRIKETESQYKVSGELRKLNVLGAFDFKGKDKILGKDILLIDDIFTTGATVDECAKVLKQNGANKVYVATIATGKVD